MSEEFDKKKAVKDLERWGEKLRKIDTMVRELYAEINDVYKEIV